MLMYRTVGLGGNGPAKEISHGVRAVMGRECRGRFCMVVDGKNLESQMSFSWVRHLLVAFVISL